MTYTNTKPDSGPSPALDAPIIKTNFSTYATIFGKNHVAMNGFNQGDHTTVIFENQSSDPGVNTDLVAIYNKDAPAKTGGPQPQIFYRIPKFLPNDSKNVPIQLTYNTVNVAGPQFQSFLPGGYVLYWGTTSNIAIPITLSPAPTKILFAVASTTTVPVLGIPVGTSITLSTTNTSQFTISSFNAIGAYTILWWAIAIA